MSHKTITIKGNITTAENKKSINGLRIEAWDKDLLIDDLLGSAVADVKGNFVISFDESYYKEVIIDRKPDVYFKVFDDNVLLTDTLNNILWNVNRDVVVTIELQPGQLKKQPDTEPVPGGEVPVITNPKQTGLVDPALQTRLNILLDVTNDPQLAKDITDAYIKAKGDWNTTKEALIRSGANAKQLTKIEFIHSLAEVSDNKQFVVQALAGIPQVSNLRDIALNHNTDSLTNLIAKQKLTDMFGTDVKTYANRLAKDVMRNVFVRETSAVVHKMVKDGALEVTDKKAAKHISTFFEKNPDFNIRTTSIYTALHDPKLFNGITETEKESTISELKKLQRLQAISTAPEALVALHASGFQSAQQVADMSENAFVQKMSSKLGKTVAANIHAGAVDAKTRNEQALMNISNYIKGAGIAAIDKIDKNNLIEKLKETADKNNIPLHWESLFGTADLCSCSHCNSVYSPAAYFVELLQYLRNNDLDPSRVGSPNSIDGTVLQKFFQRRPDLGCLELSCKNANTVLPYIDLVNEVMESFVVHLQSTEPLHQHTDDPENASYKIDTWNIADESAGELLAEPQHTNYRAYQVLNEAVYPMQLPYNMPVDEVRSFLEFSGSSRHELMETFLTDNTPHPTMESWYVLPAGRSFSYTAAADPDKNALIRLNKTALEAAVNAEYLGLTGEEYVIATKEWFWPKEYFEKKYDRSISDADYSAMTGNRNVHEYYGYPTVVGLRDPLPVREFMDRTGLKYTEVIELLKLPFINPYLPDEYGLGILESLPFNYHELQRLVRAEGGTDAARAYSDVLKKHWKEPEVNVCASSAGQPGISIPRQVEWLTSNFEKAGRMIVLQLQQDDVFGKPEQLDVCDLDHIKLVHLNGTPLTADEYDRIYRFLRMQRKLKWSFRETDRAIMVLGRSADGTVSISASFINNLAKAKKLQESTSIAIDRLLTFWSNIDTGGENSLYKRLFLRPAMKEFNHVFHADSIGRYLSDPSLQIGNYTSVLQAAFNVNREDLEAIIETAGLAMHAPLTLENVSAIYRHVLLIRLLQVKGADIHSIKTLLGEPFSSVTSTKQFIERWTNTTTQGYSYERFYNLVTDTTSDDASTESLLSQLSRTLEDGIGAINEEHPNLLPDEYVPSEMVREKLSLLYDADRTDMIIRVLEGTMEYSLVTDPGLPLNTESLSNDLREQFLYNPATGKLTVTGLLSDTEKQLITGSPVIDGPWLTAFNRLNNLAISVYEQHLEEIFEDDEAARRNLLAADTDTRAAEQKRRFLMQTYIPLLRKKLKEKFVTETVSYYTNLSSDITSYLLTNLQLGDPGRLLINIFTSDTPAPAILKAAYSKLQKAALLINDCGLSIKEVAYFQSARTGVDFGNIQPASLARLTDYTALRNNLPKTATDLVIFYEWAATVDSETDELPIRIAAVTNWKVQDVKVLIAETNFNWRSPVYFRDEENFFRLQKALTLSTKINDDLNKIFLLAKPVSAIPHAFLISSAIRANCKSGTEAAEWEKVVKPIQDKLRESRRDALIHYILHQQVVKQWGVVDADGLFEFFLIDVQMDACMETSRIKQAINSVQLYVQRCFLGLEEQYGVAGNALDKTRWEWMQRNVLWEANRKVFLYPENWIEEDLRDNKSPFFKELESELLQKDLNKETVADALKSYLYKLDEVANMQVVGLYVQDGPTPVIHVFSRTRNAPYFFYYRRYDELRNWTPWEKVQVDIPSYDVEENNRIMANGCYLAPAMIGKRLFIFFPEFRRKTKPKEILVEEEGGGTRSATIADTAREPATESRMIEYWEIKIGWSEFRNGKWTQKQLSKESVTDMPVMTSNLNELILKTRDAITFALEARIQTDNGLKTLSEIRTAYDDYIQALERIRTESTVGDVVTAIFLGPFAALVGHELHNVLSDPMHSVRLAFSDINRVLRSMEQLQEDARAAKIKADNFLTTLGVTAAVNEHLLETIRDHASNTPTILSEATELTEIARQAFNMFGRQPLDEHRPWIEILGRVRDHIDRAKIKAEGLLRMTTELHNALIAALAGIAPVLSPVSDYQFIPIAATGNRINISLYKKSLINSGWEPLNCNGFEFNGNGLNLTNNRRINNAAALPEHFHQKYYVADNFDVFKTIHSLQAMDPNPGVEQGIAHDYYFEDGPAGAYYKQELRGRPVEQQPLFHHYAHQLLSGVNEENLPQFFENTNVPAIVHEGRFNAFGKINGFVYNELKTPYALYNWELFFHIPVLLADRLSKSQHFDAAMQWYHFVFNPLSQGTEVNRAWRFLPFKEQDEDDYLLHFFHQLQPNTPRPEITAWRDHPFAPHVIARDRPTAYMKFVVMKYLDNLIAWGDHLFRQHTIESINQATQLYILASHVLGERPQEVPKPGKSKSETYRSLLNRWDAFGNALTEMELVAPFSIETTEASWNSGKDAVSTNIFGTASALYFCIPDNPKITAYRDTIDDRLFKIRHCQNIDGVFSLPPLWDAAIDPSLLVQATAQGINISTLLNELESPMPNYRFYYLLQKALELCNELKSMGSALLSVLEKKDSETLSHLRAGHETTVHNLLLQLKRNQLQEAEATLEALKNSRKSPVYRLKHYLQLIGEDMDHVPEEDADFLELANSVEAPIEESGMKLSRYEKEEMDKAIAAAEWQLGIGSIETLASILNLIPNLAADVKPLGVGAGVTFGGINIGNAMQATARGMQVYAAHLSHQSSSAQRKGGFIRALQDRVFQANLAGYEIKQIDRQLLTQKIRVHIAQREIENQQKQFDNSLEVETFLRNKYTNAELYSWMENSIRTLHRQVYTLASDLAGKAERAFCFERGVSSSNLIQSGYWDNAYDGLHSGEKLYVALKQLEAAYHEKRGWDYEVTKHISISQLDPVNLLQLKQTGKCTFEIPEVLFDIDFPGHYMRRIKSVSMTIPCITGPYTNVNATLRLVENKTRKTAAHTSGYTEKTNEPDERFMIMNIPVTAIAASSGQNDSGVFELNFKDERYLPFEGAGVISKWELELPMMRQFDYNSISDVVLHMKYTSKEGGSDLKRSAHTEVRSQLNAISQGLNGAGLHLSLNLKQELSREWMLLKQNGWVNLAIDRSRLPFMMLATGVVPVIDEVIFMVKATDTVSHLAIASPATGTSTELRLSYLDDIKLYKGESEGITFDIPFKISIDVDDLARIGDVWMIVKYRV